MGQNSMAKVGQFWVVINTGWQAKASDYHFLRKLTKIPGVVNCSHFLRKGERGALQGYLWTYKYGGLNLMARGGDK